MSVDVIIAARMNAGLTTREAAAKLGMSHGTYLRAERGERVRPGHSKKIADFCSVKVTDLWPVGSDEERAA